MSRGKQSSGGNGLNSRGNGSKGGVGSRGPGVSSLNNKIPPIGSSGQSGSGAGFSSKSPYGQPTGGQGAKLNTNVFNIPKYGSGGLGGGIGGIGAYGQGGLGGGLGGGIGAISAARLKSREKDLGSGL